MLSRLVSPGDLIPDILFAFPPSPRKYDFAYHLGAAYVRSYLNQHHIETAQFITSRPKTIPRIVTEILELNPKVVGFTCYDANYPYVRLLARSLKKHSPHLKILLGGPTATFSSQKILNHTPEIDVCIRGEGEHTTLELLQNEFSNLESIKGITFQLHNKIISTPSRPLISSDKKGAELDVLPSPYLEELIPPDGKTGILTGRGCVYHCTYCNFSAMFSHTIRYHSVNRVMAELELIDAHWNPHSKQKMMIQDDIFSLNLKRAKAICQKIIDKGITLPLSVETRADNCDKELIELMREAGVTWINFGLESASPKVLRAIKKAPDEKKFLKQIKTAVTWAKEAGIRTSVSCIFGLPEEGFSEAEKTLDFVRKLKVDEYYHNILFLFPGTELFETREQFGLQVAHSPTFLPYETLYAYQVQKIKPLLNAGMNKQIKLWKKTYCDVLTYEGVDGEYENEKVYTYLFIKEMPKDTDQLCNWLHNVSALHLSVVDSENGEKNIAHRIATLIEGGVPVGFYCTANGGDCEPILTLYSQADLKTSVPEIPFAEWKRGVNELVTLERKEDVQAFGQFLENHIEEGILSFSVDETPHMLMDACRWGKTECPALSRGFLTIEGNKVLSCYHGVCLGNVGDSLSTFQKNYQALLAEKNEERGCQDCSIKNECSRCFSPYSLTDSKFCHLKRKYPSISRVIPLLKWLYMYAEQDDALIQFRMDEKASPLFYKGKIKRGRSMSLPNTTDTVNLISHNGKAIVFTEERSFSLDPVKAAILEACELHVEKEALVSYVEKENKDRSFVDSVLFTFKTLNLLK